MHHRPTKLALLISLIGVSGTSYAWVNEPVEMVSAVTSEATEPGAQAGDSWQAAARIDATTRARALAAVRDATSHDSRMAGKSGAARSDSVSWVQAYRPGIDALDDFVAALLRADLSSSTAQAAAKQERSPATELLLTHALEAAAVSAPRQAYLPTSDMTLASGSSTNPLPMSGEFLSDASGTGAAVQADLRDRLAPSFDAPASHQASRVMDSLAAIVLDDMTVLGDTATHRRIAERFPGWVEQTTAGIEPKSSAARAGASLVAEPRRILVGTQSTKVLSNLQHVLTASVDALPMLATQAPELVVATQADKVLALLSDVRERNGDQRIARAPRSTAAVQMPSEGRSNADGTAAKPGATLNSEDQTRALTPVGSARTSSGLAGGAVDIALDLPDSAGSPVALDIDLSQPLPGRLKAEPSTPVPQPAKAPAVASEASPFGDTQVAVSESSLDGVRGGFVANGLNISFGVERAVYQNGALVATTSLNVSELGKMTAGSVSAAVDKSTLALIQSGSGNTFTPGMNPANSFGTIVQNTLDGQKIQNLTVINATANSLNVLRGVNLQSSLRGAVIDSLRR